MSEWRADPVTGRWVVIAADEPLRRRDFDLDPVIPIDEAYCPLCEGEEAVAGHEIAAVRDGTAVGRARAGGCGWSPTACRRCASKARSTIAATARSSACTASARTRSSSRRRGTTPPGRRCRSRTWRWCSPPGATGWPTCSATRGCGRRWSSRTRASRPGRGWRIRTRRWWRCRWCRRGAGRGGGRRPPLLRRVRPVRVLRAGRAGTGRRHAGGRLDRRRAWCWRRIAARWPFETWLLPRAHHARFELAPGIAAGRGRRDRAAGAADHRRPPGASRP